MNKSFFEQIQDAADYLNLDLNAQEMAQLAVDHEYSEENIRIVAEMFTYLQQKKKENNNQEQYSFIYLLNKESKEDENSFMVL